tara:strand:- start:124 stop:1443 length:1320 start_codon:yes stop_codon:yes gene_type:complete
MASLTFDIPKKGDLRVGIFLDKVKKGKSHELVGGGNVVLTSVKARTDQREIPIKSLSLQQFRNKISGTGYKFYDAAGTEYGITKLFKSDEYKDDGKTNYNKGNVAEILFAGAMYLRFCSKTRQVTESDLRGLIRSLPAGKNMGRVSKQSPNKNPKVRKDFVHFIYGLSKNNYDAVKNDQLWPAWSKLIQASLLYANSQDVTKYADLFYNNNLHNRIVVFADGETDQVGTKVDVKVTANDHQGKDVPLNLNISLKAGPVKQFGQYGGVSYDVQQKLWDEFFDIKLPFNEEKFLSFMGTENHDNDAANCLNFSYEQVAPHVAKALNNPNKLDKFFKAVNFHMTRNENPVFLVQLDDKGRAIKYDTSDLKEKAKGLEFKAVLGKSGELPKMSICTTIDGMENVFLDIRVKRGDYLKDGTPYYRNIFEKGKNFTKLLSTLIDD